MIIKPPMIRSKNHQKNITNLHFIDHKLVTEIASNLSLSERLALKLKGCIQIGFIKVNSKHELPGYLFKCPTHGYQISYRISFESVLYCPECVRLIKSDVAHVHR